MLFIYRLTIPANTAESDKEQLDFKLPRGTINKVEVAFPAGAMGEAHLQIFHQEHQLFPTVLGESFAWDNASIVWLENYELPEAWNELSLRGWNTDDTFQHTVTVRFATTLRAWTPADLESVYLPLEF